MWKRTALWIGTSLAACAPAMAQVTSRMSVGANGEQANQLSYGAAISADGRFVAFGSWASNLVPGDTNGTEDVFVRDLVAGTIERVSIGSAGEEGNDRSDGPNISIDGRFVTFWTAATNLVPGDFGDIYDVLIRDRWLGTTEKVSVSSSGVPGDADSMSASMSRDGRYVAFQSIATNFDPNHGVDFYWQVYVRDRQLGTTDLASLSAAGVAGFGHSQMPVISDDGQFVAFVSSARNLVPGDSGTGVLEVYRKDRVSGAVERIDVNTLGGQSNATDSYGETISGDGRFVGFTSDGSDLITGDTNGKLDAFVRDCQTATTFRASMGTNDVQGDGDSFIGSISRDGRYVTFVSTSVSFFSQFATSARSAYVRDLQTGITERVSVSSGGWRSNGDSSAPARSDDGRFFAFENWGTDLVPFDTNGWSDVFLRDRLPGSGTTAFTSLCEPGIDGVVMCPCQNPPPGPGSGCDNSAITGGAILSASGITGVTTDGLTFHVSGLPDHALGVLAQGNALLPAGSVYGQGVRCVAGQVKRLGSRTAVAGELLLPNLPMGDVRVSVRSAQKGDRIQAGESRWYYVFYRDPTVLGSCPQSSTFNATQAGRIDWFL